MCGEGVGPRAHWALSGGGLAGGRGVPRRRQRPRGTQSGVGKRRATAAAGNAAAGAAVGVAVAAAAKAAILRRGDNGSTLRMHVRRSDVRKTKSDFPILKK